MSNGRCLCLLRSVADNLLRCRHEHLYESIEERLIRSDDLFSDPVSTERRLGGSTTILCTVSMLSNPALDNCGVFHMAPVERLVVDEASQIESFEFMVSGRRICMKRLVLSWYSSICSTSSCAWKRSVCLATQSSVSLQHEQYLLSILITRTANIQCPRMGRRPPRR